MPLHFSRQEFDLRLNRTLAAMRDAELEGMLLFNQASRYWLTGYDSFGFVLFECLVVGADGRMVLLTRPTDVPAAHYTSILDDVRIWEDGAPTAATDALKTLLLDLRYAGRRFGVEYHSFGLTGRNARLLDETLSESFRLVDASELISRLRVTKSEAELVYVRRAAELANDALAEARRLARPGAFEGDILAAAQGAVFRGGGDYPGNEFTLASGAGALLPRYFSGRRHLDAKDQLMLQLGGAYRRYHAALMVTICVGGAIDRQRAMHRVARDCLKEAHAMLRPGCRLGDIYEMYEQAAEQAGFGAGRLSGCGYSLGAAYHPTWMEWPWIFSATDVIAEPNMVFYIHMVLIDREAGYAMAVADTSVVTENGSERLTLPQLDILEA